MERKVIPLLHVHVWEEEKISRTFSMVRKREVQLESRGGGRNVLTALSVLPSKRFRKRFFLILCSFFSMISLPLSENEKRKKDCARI